MRASNAKPPRAGNLSRLGLLAVSGGMVLLLGNCGAFNPAFLSIVTPGGAEDFASIPNPSGHVVVALVNNTQVDERLVDYLAPRLDLPPAEIRSLRPRVRLRVQITFVDGTTRNVEMISGTQSLVDPAFDAEAFPDLNQNDLTNVVVACDVAAVQLEPGSSIEVFVPVELIGFELVETTGTGGQAVTEFQERQRTPPSFRPLQVDDVDDDGNVVLRRNIGVRDQPSPTTNLVCGSVVAITMRGVLAVPFLDVVSSDPSFDLADEQTVARIGGRFEFDVSVQ